MSEPNPDILLRLRGVQHNILADMTREAADEIERLRAELAAEGATTASLLRIIALIREAGGFTREDLAALPGAVKAMRQQRDEARRWLRDACAEEEIVLNAFTWEVHGDGSIGVKLRGGCKCLSDLNLDAETEIFVRRTIRDHVAYKIAEAGAKDDARLFEQECARNERRAQGGGA